MGRAHFQPLNRSVAGTDFTHTHKEEGRAAVGSGSAGPSLSQHLTVSQKYPVSLNKRQTIWQEAIRDTAGLKIDPLPTDSTVFHDLLVYSPVAVTLTTHLGIK